MSLFLIVILPFLGALLPGLMNPAGRQSVAGITFMVSLAAMVGLFNNLPAILSGEHVNPRIESTLNESISSNDFFINEVIFFFMDKEKDKN